MNYTHGLILRNTVEAMQAYVVSQGDPVIVNNQCTLEILNFGFDLSYSYLIDVEDIKKNMLDYYSENEIDYKNLEELEKNEYSVIMTKLFEKFELLKQDKNSRQVLFTDDCCISMIHYLIRNNKIYCYMHMRSSDCINKLFSDLNLVHRITRKLQDITGICFVDFNFTANSLHQIIYDVKKVK